MGRQWIMQRGTGTIGEQPVQQAPAAKEPPRAGPSPQRRHARKLEHSSHAVVYPAYAVLHDSKPCSLSRWSSMWEPAIALFPIFRSRITAAVLTKTYVGDSEYSIAELAGLAHTDTGTMSREVRRLEAGRDPCAAGTWDAPS